MSAESLASAMAQASPGPFSTIEVDFLSEDAILTIVPNFPMPEFTTVDGATYGPFSPMIPLDVPMWLALRLRKDDRCRIQAPDWLDVPTLDEIKRKELDNPSVFQPLPSHCFEISHAILTHAADDVQDAGRVQQCLKAIEETRLAKITAGLQAVTAGTTHILLSNITTIELQSVRGFCFAALSAYKSVSIAARAAALNKPDERWPGTSKDKLTRFPPGGLSTIAAAREAASGGAAAAAAGGARGAR